VKVSIITIVFNRKLEIEQTIQSVINQTYSDIEYIIVDGGSTDGTVDIIKGYQTKLAKFISETDKGIYDAINKGINLATGDIIGLIHAGDILFDDLVISKIVQHFHKTGADILYGNTFLVRPDNIQKVERVFEGCEYKHTRFITGWMPSHISVYIKREVFQLYGNYRLDLNIAADYELLLRFMYRYRVKSSYYQGVIARFRLGGISNKNIYSFLKSGSQCYRAWKLNDLKIAFYTIPFKYMRRIPDIVFSRKRLKKYLL
jgi:glycosyltransferase involved in cell wall biosynthesis